MFYMSKQVIITTLLQVACYLKYRIGIRPHSLGLCVTGIHATEHKSIWDKTSISVRQNVQVDVFPHGRFAPSIGLCSIYAMWTSRLVLSLNKLINNIYNKDTCKTDKWVLLTTHPSPFENN